MSDQSTPEPTMEEILASIRRIISEDEPPPAPEAAVEAPAEPAPRPVAAKAQPEPPAEDVLELTVRVAEAEVRPAAAALVETHGDLEVLKPGAAAPAPPPPAPVAAAPAYEESLLSPPAAEAASSAFGQLTQSILMPKDGRTLEDVVRELLRPLLKAWLDEHLPGIVQATVAEEVERVSRRRV
jgi:cell pole-organizing protein PopZ